MWLALNSDETQLALLDVTGTLRFLNWPLQQPNGQISAKAQAVIQVWSCPPLSDKIVRDAKCWMKGVPTVIMSFTEAWSLGMLLCFRFE